MKPDQVSLSTIVPFLFGGRRGVAKVIEVEGDEVAFHFTATAGSRARGPRLTGHGRMPRSSFCAVANEMEREEDNRWAG